VGELEALAIDGNTAYSIVDKAILSYQQPLLVKFDLSAIDVAAPLVATPVGSIPVTLVDESDGVFGLDINPQTGELYALFQATAGNGIDRLLVLDKTTGAIVKEVGQLFGELQGDAIVIEAENPDSITSPLFADTGDDALGGGFLTGTIGNESLNQAPANGRASYTFNVTDAGTYELWARSSAPDGDADSWWVRVDGGSWIRWNGATTPNNEFVWQHVHNSDASNQKLQIALTAGQHTVEFAYREAGARIDQIAWNPVGLRGFGMSQQASTSITSTPATTPTPNGFESISTSLNATSSRFATR
jgi:hypothetical protein